MPALWDLPADKQALQTEEPLQVGWGGRGERGENEAIGRWGTVYIGFVLRLLRGTDLDLHVAFFQTKQHLAVTVPPI